MLHKDRKHSYKVYTDVDELVRDLKEKSWCGCQGFVYGRLVLRNDQTSGDGIFEANIARDVGDGKIEEFESWTIDWMERDALRGYILKEVSPEGGAPGVPLTLPERWPAHGYGTGSGPCHLCR